MIKFVFIDLIQNFKEDSDFSCIDLFTISATQPSCLLFAIAIIIQKDQINPQILA